MASRSMSSAQKKEPNYSKNGDDQERSDIVVKPRQSSTQVRPQWWKKGAGCDKMTDQTISGNPEHPEKQSSFHVKGARHKS